MIIGLVLFAMFVSAAGVFTQIKRKQAAREADVAHVRRRRFEMERRKALLKEGKDPDAGRPRSRRIRNKRGR